MHKKCIPTSLPLLTSDEIQTFFTITLVKANFQLTTFVHFYPQSLSHSLSHLPNLLILVVHEVDEVSRCLGLGDDDIPRGLSEDHLVEDVDHLQNHVVVFLPRVQKQDQGLDDSAVREQGCGGVVRTSCAHQHHHLMSRKRCMLKLFTSH